MCRNESNVDDVQQVEDHRGVAHPEQPAHRVRTLPIKAIVPAVDVRGR